MSTANDFRYMLEDSFEQTVRYASYVPAITVARVLANENDINSGKSRQYIFCNCRKNSLDSKDETEINSIKAVSGTCFNLIFKPRRNVF